MDSHGIHDVEIDWPAFCHKKSVKLDGQEVAVTKVSFEADVEGLPLVTLTFYANINANVSGRTANESHPHAQRRAVPAPA